MRLKLFLMLLFSCITHNQVFAEEKPLQVLFAGTSHIGGRTNNEDRWRYQTIQVNDSNYHLTMVCDGHGIVRGHEVAEKVIQEFGGILEHCLTKKNNFKKAVPNAFIEMDKRILEIQKTDQNEPGSTAVMLLLNETDQQACIANLGDSRLQIASAADGKAIWNTTDHTGETELPYIQCHGGILVNHCLGKRIVLKDRQNLDKVEPARAFGDAFLKSFVGDDGKTGPLSAVPDITIMPLQENVIYLLFSDAVSKALKIEGDSSPELAWNRMIQKRDGGTTYWSDILNLDDTTFYAKYKWECTDCTDVKKMKHIQLIADDSDIDGNDGHLKKIIKRLIYISQYISDDHGTLDNTTIVAVRVKKLLEKIPTELGEIPEKKNYNDYQMRNFFMNRYFCFFTVVVGSFLYYYYSR
jgi:serine/threonine protein phosphatase PrpC